MNEKMKVMNLQGFGFRAKESLYCPSELTTPRWRPANDMSWSVVDGGGRKFYEMWDYTTNKNNTPQQQLFFNRLIIFGI